MSWNNWFHTNLRWPLDCTRRTWRISRTSKISFCRPPEFWPSRNGISLSGVNFLWSLKRTSNNEPKLIYHRPCHAALDETHHCGSVLHQRKESNHHRFPAGKKKLNSLFERIFPPSKKDMPFWELPKIHNKSSQKEQHKSPKHIQNKQTFPNFPPNRFRHKQNMVFFLFPNHFFRHKFWPPKNPHRTKNIPHSEMGVRHLDPSEDDPSCQSNRQRCPNTPGVKLGCFLCYQPKQLCSKKKEKSWHFFDHQFCTSSV